MAGAVLATVTLLLGLSNIVLASAFSPTVSAARLAPDANETAIRAIPQRMQALWAEVTSGQAPPETIAAVFTEDADFIVGDGTHLHGRAEIVAYYQKMIDGADAFGTSLRDTTVVAEPQSVRMLDDKVAVMLTQGGILLPGETTVPAERLGIQSWVLVKVGEAWLVSAYQNTRIAQQP